VRLEYADGVVAARAAATPFVFVLVLCLLAQASPLAASVRVEGLNSWLAAGAVRSLEAVYDHIPPGETPDYKVALLEVVAEKLLSGYIVKDILWMGSDVLIVLDEHALVPRWRVSIAVPNLSPPVNLWFESDLEGLNAEIASLLDGVPVEALTWGDLDLKREVDALCQPRLPGWRASLIVRRDSGDSVTIDVSFTPEQPLTLVVMPRINSASIPVLLHSNMREDLLRGFAPIIGIPVPWLDIHSEDFAALGREILNGESLVEEARAVPDVTVKTGVVSELNIDLESRRYAAWVWFAVYGGAEDRYPEAGLHFGRRTLPFSGWEVELYGEFIVSLNDWDPESRFGVRWAPSRNIWLGGEWSDSDSSWWIKASIEARPLKPYAWLRYSLDGYTNGAVGYRFNDFMSIELNYDSRFPDSWFVRGLVNL
jgi:hypothetical protein